MNQFEINGITFSLTKLDAFKQFHIVRRVAPLLGELGPSMVKISQTSKSDSKSETEKLEEIVTLFAPVFKGISELSDKDADFVLLGLLSCVQRKQEANWAYIVVGGQLAFHDLDLPVMLQLAGRAFAFNLSGFFGALPKS